MTRPAIRTTSFIATMVLLAAAGCTSSTTGPEPERRLGVIAFYGEPAVVQTPESVRVGESFQVSVRTYGGGCITKNGTEVSAAGLTAEVRPYDVHSGHEVCTQELRMFDHQATLTFDEPGTATVVFAGLQQPDETPVTVTRTVTVR